LKTILFYIILIAIWELIYKLGVGVLHWWKSYAFPSPLSVFQTLVSLGQGGSLELAVLVSMKRMVIGYLLSAVLGVTLGLLVSQMQHFGSQFNAFILGLQSLPSICWLPFAVLWFGINESSVLFVTTIGSTFAISLAVISGIKNINPLYIHAAKTMGVQGIMLYRDVMIPAALPNLVTGLKQGWSFAWRALMAGEMMSSTHGLGVMLMQGRDFGDISQVVAMMIVIIVIGLAVDRLLFGRLERKVWRRWGLNQH